MWITKKKLEKLVMDEVMRRLPCVQPKIIYEVEVSKDMSKQEVQEYLEKFKQKLIVDLQLKAGSFLVVATNNGVGHVNVTHI